jgi:hypothetical protein
MEQKQEAHIRIRLSYNLALYALILAYGLWRETNIAKDVRSRAGKAE